MDQGNVPVPGSPQGGQKKGLHPMAWVGIGCGALLIIGVVAVAMAVGTCTRKVNKWAKDMQKDPQKSAAEMMVRFNPDLEMVSQDEGTGEMTIKVKSSGEQITMSYKDIAEGKLTVKDAEGNVTQLGGKSDMSNVPKWVPRYPGGEAASGVFQQKQGSKVEGIVSMTTADAPEKVVAFFKEACEKEGLTVGTENSMNLGNQQLSVVELSGNGKKLTVTASKNSGEDKTTVALNYSEGVE